MAYFRKKTDEEIQLLLEEAQLEYNEIRSSERDTYQISWKLDQIRGEILRRKLKLDEKKLIELVSMTQDSLLALEKIRNDWKVVKKTADTTTYTYFKQQEREQFDIQTAIHLQINSPT